MNSVTMVLDPPQEMIGLLDRHDPAPRQGTAAKATTPFRGGEFYAGRPTFLGRRRDVKGFWCLRPWRRHDRSRRRSTPSSESAQPSPSPSSHSSSRATRDLSSDDHTRPWPPPPEPSWRSGNSRRDRWQDSGSSSPCLHNRDESCLPMTARSSASDPRRSRAGRIRGHAYKSDRWKFMVEPERHCIAGRWIEMYFLDRAVEIP